MMRLYGRTVSREDLLAYTTDITNLGGVRMLELADGAGRGVRVAQFRTGSGFSFDVLLDRGMDIGRAEHNGRPISWWSAVGSPHPAYYEATPLGFLHIFHGGLMAGCGLDNVGPPNVDQGEELMLHGRLSAIPASLTSYGGQWMGDSYRMWVEGQVRQASLFGSNLLLTRRIWSDLGEDCLHLEDAIENQGFHRAPYQILYHCNLGFPLLSPDSELLVDSTVKPRDEDAAVGAETWNTFHEPVPDYPEQVFLHQPVDDGSGYGQATLVNRALGFGAYVRFCLAELPNLVQWKMMEKGTYVLGLEPASCGILGRAKDRELGTLRFLEPGEKVELRLEIGVLADKEAIEKYEEPS